MASINEVVSEFTSDLSGFALDLSGMLTKFGTDLSAALSESLAAANAPPAVDPDVEVKANLVAALENDKFNGRSIGALAKIAGKDEDATRALLNEIGASHFKTGARTGRQYYSL